MENAEEIIKTIKKNNSENLELLKKILIKNGIKEPEDDVVYEMYDNACKLLETEIIEMGI